MYSLYTNSGTVGNGAYFSYKLFNYRNKTEMTMDKFRLRNLPECFMPENCVVNEQNNIAGYCAVLYGLQAYVEKYGYNQLTIYTTQLIIDQINNELEHKYYQCSDQVKHWVSAITKNWFNNITLKVIKEEKIAEIFGG